MNALQVLPYMPPYTSTGNFVPKIYGQAGDPMLAIDLLDPNQANKNYAGQGTFFAIIEPMKGLSLESRISSGLNYNNNYTFTPTYSFGSRAW